jgi:hypothetical protein
LINTNVNIVIPIYLKHPDDNGIASLIQCFKVLNNHRFTFICNLELEDVVYKQLADKYAINYSVERFEDRFFQNLQGYNSLLVSPVFYSRFTGFDYILIYQLDSYVFFDNLKEWCSLNYDYVAAPWIEAFWLKGKKKQLMKKALQSKTVIEIISHKVKWLFKGYFKKNALTVGNGGFSLRRTNTFLNISLQLKSGSIWHDNEDVFWSIHVPLNFEFKVPKYKKAAEFSFDLNPEIVFEINQRKLPMGCHAWYRTDFPYGNNLSFWKGKIV